MGKDFTAEDIVNFQTLAGSGNPLQQLARSLAPSIHGHELVKKGLALQLLGGRERILDNGVPWLYRSCIDCDAFACLPQSYEAATVSIKGCDGSRASLGAKVLCHRCQQAPGRY